MKKQRLSIGKDILFYLPSQLVLGVMGFITIRYQTDFFSKEQMGNFDLISIGVKMGVLVLGGWIFQAALRFYEQYESEEKQQVFYSTILMMFLLINMIGVGLILSVMMFLENPADQRLLLWGIIAFIGQAATTLLYNLLRAKKEKLWYAILNSAGAIAKLVLLVLFVKRLHLGVESIFLSMGIVDILIGMIVFIRFKVVRYLSLKGVQIKDAKYFFAYGFPLIGVVVCSTLLNYLDRYCIGIFWGDAEVGLYGRGYGIVSASMIIFSTLIMAGTYPIVVSVWNKEGRKPTEIKLGQAVRYYLLLTIPAVVGLSSLATWIFQTIIVKPEYFMAYKVVPWVAVAYLCLGLTEFSNKIFELLKRTKMILYFNGLAAFVNLVLNIILIPLYGYEAAAVTTFLSYLLYFGLSIWFSRKEFTFVIMPASVIKMIVASGSMYIGIKMGMRFLEPNLMNLFILILCGAVIYGIILLVSGELKAELQGFKNMKI